MFTLGLLPSSTRSANIDGFLDAQGVSRHQTPGQVDNHQINYGTPTERRKKRRRRDDSRVNRNTNLIRTVLHTIEMVGMPATLKLYPTIPEGTIYGWKRSPPLKIVTGD